MITSPYAYAIEAVKAQGTLGAFGLGTVSSRRACLRLVDWTSVGHCVFRGHERHAMQELLLTGVLLALESGGHGTDKTVEHITHRRMSHHHPSLPRGAGVQVHYFVALQLGHRGADGRCGRSNSAGRFLTHFCCRCCEFFDWFPSHS